MHISSLTVSGLRGFSSPQTIEFALPTEKPGSGLTILIGPNNGGKSTVVEALRAMTSEEPPSFTEGKRNKEADDRVSITLTLDTGDRHELRTIDAGGSETIRVPSEKIPIPIYVLPSRRYFNPFFGRGSYDRESYIRHQGFPFTRGAAIDEFSSRLFRVLGHRSEFDEVLSHVLDPVPDWTIDQADGGQYYLKVNAGQQYHTSDGLGEGIVSLFFLVDALYDSSEGDVIVIDEPELSLHPSLQRKLVRLLAEYAKYRQIVYATHSPYFVDFSHVIVGAKVVRIHKAGGASVVSQLKPETAAKLEGFLNNLNNPHILGLDGREALFMDDGIVLVEGQEDVVFYSRLLEKLNSNLPDRFYGWGVGGADNIPVIASMLADLGFTRVAAILDGGKKDQLPELQASFPSYHFTAIPAVDVRTKPAVPARDAVEGLLGEDGKLRPEFEEETIALFKSVEHYISQSR